MSRRNTTNPLIYLAPILVVTVLVVAGIFLFLRNDNSVDDGQGWVIIDGWSWEMRGDNDVDVIVDNAAVDVEFRPVTTRDLEELLTINPAAVRELAARVATADPTLVCTEQGCETAEGPLDLDDIVKPTAANLRAAGVEHGAWVARPDTDGVASVGARMGDSSATLALNGTGPVAPDAPAGAPTDEQDSIGADVLTIEPDEPSTPTEPTAPITPEEYTEELPEGLEVPDVVIEFDGSGELPDMPDEVRERLERLEGMGTEEAAPVDAAPLPDDAQQAPSEMDLGAAPELETQPQLGPEDAELEPVTPSTAPPPAPLQDNPDSGVDPAPDDALVDADMTAEEPTEIPADEKPPVVVAGIAWGQVFVLSTPWFSEGEPSDDAFGAPREVPSPVANSAGVPDQPFTNGLATTDPAATMLTPSQLTAWSAPLIGCGLGVVCAADAAHVEIVETSEPETARLCYQDVTAQTLGLEVAPVPVDVVVRARTFTFDGATERVQLGAWPADTPTPPAALWPVPPPAFSDTSELTVHSAEIYDADGLLLTVGSQAPQLDGGWSLDTLAATGFGTFFTACE